MGDCYFLSSLSSIAENQNRIRKLFVTKQKNPYGLYCVRLCVMGEWQEIVMDDLFPCYNRRRGPCFTRGSGKELWVLLLEKAWAKIYGNYLRIEGGLTKEALHNLTGAPAETIFMSEERLWNTMIEGERHNWIMTCGSGSSVEGVNQLQKSGLVGSHAYSVLSAHNVQSHGRQIQLVKLRNPWGGTEWQGDWGDNSHLWTPELKAQLHFQNIDDGIFFMDFNDFKKYFTDFQACYYYENYKYSCIKHRVAYNQPAYFEMKVTTPGDYYITVNQESKRKYPSESGYKYSIVQLVIGKQANNGGYEYYGSASKAWKEMWTKTTLTPGTYVVYVAIDWYQKNSRMFTLTSYGQNEVKFAPLQMGGKDFLEPVFKSRGRSVPEQKKKNYARYNEPNIYKATSFDDAYAFFYFDNRLGKATLVEDISFREMEGLTFLPPYSGSNAKIEIRSEERRVGKEC